VLFNRKNKKEKRLFRVPLVEIPHHSRIPTTGEWDLDDKHDVYPKYTDAAGITGYMAVYSGDECCDVYLYSTREILDMIADYPDVEELS